MNIRFFTLLELLLVTIILALVASTAMLAIDSGDDQLRYDENKRRLQELRLAILGDETSSLNNQPIIQGYIADTGETPTSVNDLLEKPSGVDFWSYDSILGFGHGWRGPYLSSWDGEYFDAWGQPYFGEDNSTWNGPEGDGDLFFKSLGKDRTVDSGGEDAYEQDRNYLISESRYKSMGPLPFNVQILNNSVANINNTKVQLMILYPDAQLPSDFSEEFVTLNSKFLSVEEYTISLLIGESINLNFTLNEDLLSRRIRIILIGPDLTGTSLADKFISDENEMAHITLLPTNYTIPSYQFELKD